MFSLVNRWVNKLTINLLSLFGASQETLNKISYALAEREAGRIEAANASTPPLFNIGRVLIIITALGAATYFIVSLLKIKYSRK
jgi:hypothetical protein